MIADRGQRFATLDIIRGVAVMGIFSVNVIAFAMIEGAYFNPAAFGGAQGADLAIWAINMVLIDGKMRSLFSILFGASMLLVIDRAEATGASGLTIHARRMAVLFVIGLAHYYLLWFGDILNLYAVVGLIAFAFRHRTPAALLRGAVVMMIVGMALFGLLLIQMRPGAAAGDFHSLFAPSAQAIARDLSIYRGGFLDRLAEMTGERRFDWLQGLIAFLPETLSLMLLGMAGYKSGYLTGGWSNAAYRRVAIITLPLGALAFGALVAVDLSARFDPKTLFGGLMVAMAPIRPMMALGYAALIILLARQGGRFARHLAAVGRAAFTNYLGTSLIAAFVFYGWGLGTYGHASRAEAWLLVPLVWLLMLAWSKPWLDRFNYGPMEWLWRSLARGHPQPMRKLAAG